ncbi:unnamed protein product [Bemisia tabaci]|uniref:Uncharacterized protein n=1 Tax=Bemisia tabaci TaxID=7038 RepID=A0A9P0CFG4_BEMTA|nr:PREDICTED: uncharacterized protein LOC109041449 [Bemisia tabaci]CAH0777358.1 unnamed protein product [Bemisia tabaci]
MMERCWKVSVILLIASDLSSFTWGAPTPNAPSTYNTPDAPSTINTTNAPSSYTQVNTKNTEVNDSHNHNQITSAANNSTAISLKGKTNGVSQTSCQGCKAHNSHNGDKNINVQTNFVKETHNHYYGEPAPAKQEYPPNQEYPSKEQSQPKQQY